MDEKPKSQAVTIRYLIISFIISIIFLLDCSSDQKSIPQSKNQNPSPMVDFIRTHDRIENKNIPSTTFILENYLSKPIEVYFKNQDQEHFEMDLLIHFHGASYVPRYAVYNFNHNLILAVINLGSGSSVYENAFESRSTFPALIEMILDSVSERKSTGIKSSSIYLSSFSAGYGAVRAILRNHLSTIDGILLLDGLHTDYLPEGQPLAEGGKLNEEKLRVFVQFAQLAIENKKKFLITHSEIFPGTYASTTETADYLLNSLNLKRNAILKWGPAGMQQLSETKNNGLTILGFAGNSAQDHVDHFHGFPEFLKFVQVIINSN